MSQVLLSPNFFDSRLARRLLKIIITAFLIVSLAVTLIQLTFEASEERDNMTHDINFTISNMQELITEKIWNIDHQGIVDTLKAIASNKYILGIELLDENGNTAHRIGKIFISESFQATNRADDTSNHSQQDHSYQFSFPLHYQLEDTLIYLGQLEVYSHESVITDYLFYYLFRSLFITFGQLLILSALFYFIVIRLVTHPIWLLSNLLSQQHLDFPIPEILMKSSEELSSRKDEIGNLFANYLRMAQLLDSKNRQVLRHQKELETRVEQRTKALQTALQELHQTSEIKSRFLANMSHEIRTPMNGIIGMTELLKNSRLNEEQLHYIATIQNSGRILTNIINDILDLTKIEAGKINFESIPFNLEDLVDLCATLFCHESIKKSIRFNLYYDPAAPKHFLGDPTRINQIVVNLLNNAFKFTDTGTITIRVKLKTASDEIANIEIEIEDTGVGISTANREALFEAFTQADPSTTRTHGGTGLGLAICDRLATLMNGKMSLESTQHKGSCFTIHLPLSVDQKSNSKSDPDSRQLDFLLHKEALLVAIEGETKDILIESLKEFQMDYHVTESAKDLNRTLINRKPDILILSQCIDVESVRIAFQSIDPAHAPTTILTVIHSEDLLEGISSSLRNRVVTLTLPFSRQNLYRVLHQIFADNHDNQESPTLNFSHLNVMVAEDNIVNQMVIKGLLATMGIDPYIVKNGHELINQINKVNPDIVFMDCEMPVLDGYEATKIIRKDELNLHIPIIGLSAHALQEQIDYALSIGMTHYLSKPIQIDELVSLIKHIDMSISDPADNC